MHVGGRCSTRTRSINPASLASRPVSLTGSHVSQRPAWKLKSPGASPKFLPDSSPGTQSSGDKVGALVACVTPGGIVCRADGQMGPESHVPYSSAETHTPGRQPSPGPDGRELNRAGGPHTDSGGPSPAPPECAHDPCSPACHLLPAGHRTRVALSVAEKTSAPRWGSMSIGPGRGALAMAAHGKGRGLARTPPGTSACTTGPWSRCPPYAAAPQNTGSQLPVRGLPQTAVPGQQLPDSELGLLRGPPPRLTCWLLGGDVGLENPSLWRAGRCLEPVLPGCPHPQLLCLLGSLLNPAWRGGPTLFPLGPEGALPRTELRRECQVREWPVRWPPGAFPELIRDV